MPASVKHAAAARIVRGKRSQARPIAAAKRRERAGAPARRAPEAVNATSDGGDDEERREPAREDADAADPAELAEALDLAGGEHAERRRRSRARRPPWRAATGRSRGCEVADRTRAAIAIDEDDAVVDSGADDDRAEERGLGVEVADRAAREAERDRGADRERRADVATSTRTERK